MTRGGKRKGAGRPKGSVTTGMASTPPVHYRVTADQHHELATTGAKRGLSANMEAKRRAFPQRRADTRKGEP